MRYLKNVNFARKIVLALVKSHKFLTMYCYYYILLLTLGVRSTCRSVTVVCLVNCVLCIVISRTASPGAKVTTQMNSTGYLHQDTYIKILTSRYLHQDTYIKILTSRYLHQDTYIKILTSRYLHQDTYIKILTSRYLHQDTYIKILTSRYLHQDTYIKILTSRYLHQDTYIKILTSRYLHQDGRVVFYIMT